MNSATAGRGSSTWPKDSAERLPIPGEEKKRQRGYHQRHWQTFRIHEQMEQEDVHDNRPQHQQSQRQKATTQNEQPTDHLEGHYHVEIACGEQRRAEIA